MQLLTKSITKKAIEQYPMGSSMDQMVVAKFFDPFGSWKWFLMNMEDESGSYAWGIVKGFEVEVGSFSVEELADIKLPLGSGIERDIFWEHKKASEVYDLLQKGEYI